MYPYDDEEEKIPLAPPADEDEGYLRRYLSGRQSNYDKELAAAEETASENRLMARLGGASEKFGAALAGTKSDQAPYEEMVKTSTQPIERLNRREKLGMGRDKLISDYLYRKSKMKQDAELQKQRMSDAAEARKANADLRGLIIQGQNDKRKTELDEKATKKQQEEEALNVPGYDRTPGVRQGKDEAEKARKAVGVLENVKQNFDRMSQLIEKYGSYEYGGAGGAEMETLTTTLKIQLKNLYELGALSGPDMSILSSQIKDPTSWGAMFTLDSNAKKMLEATKENLERGAKNQLKAQGYVPKAGDAAPPGPQPGAVEQGYRFKGGDPKDQKNWEKI